VHGNGSGSCYIAYYITGCIESSQCTLPGYPRASHSYAEFTFMFTNRTTMHDTPSNGSFSLQDKEL